MAGSPTGTQPPTSQLLYMPAGTPHVSWSMGCTQHLHSTIVRLPSRMPCPVLQEVGGEDDAAHVACTVEMASLSQPVEVGAGRPRCAGWTRTA